MGLKEASPRQGLEDLFTNRESYYYKLDMYILGFITFIYLYIAGKKFTQNEHVIYELPTMMQIYRIIVNLLGTDALAAYTFWVSDIFTSFSFCNLVMFFVVQDFYFYAVHKLLHKFAYRIHKTHHETFGPILAWNASLIDHFLLNVGSLAIPFLLFPNTRFILLLLITLEIYTSVNGHTYNSYHHLHHNNPTKRLGSIYIFDRLFGSY